MTDDELKLLFAEGLALEPSLARRNAGEIWNRARRDEIVERYAREGRSAWIAERLGGVLGLFAVDVVVAALIVPAGGLLMAILGAAAVHTAGTIVSASHL